MRIIVTGGAGFIGSHVAERAMAEGHEVAVLDDLSTGRRENVPQGAKFYEVDIRDREATERAMADFKPTAVSHQAAQASVVISMRDPALDASVNVVGGLHVLDAACKAGAERFIFASTGGAIYGNVAEGAAAEDHPALPVSPYAIHKFCFEQLLGVYARDGRIQPTVLRYSNVYGPRQDPHGEAGVVAIFSRRALNGQPLTVFGNEKEGDDGCLRDYVHVSDAVRANLLALSGQLQVGLINVATSVATSTRELAHAIARFGGSNSAVTSGPPRPGDVARSVLASDLFRAHVGEPLGFEKGLEETVSWFREQHRPA